MYEPNPQHPSGFTRVVRVDLAGDSHGIKGTELKVPTPHIQGKNIEGGVRPTLETEIPKYKK